MNTYAIGGVILSAIIGTIGAFKIEFIREVVRNVTSDKEKVNAFSLVLLLALAVIPTVVGFSISTAPKENETTETKEVKDSTGETNAEVALKGTEEAVTDVSAVAEQVIAANEEKEKEFEASRGERWAYRIGDCFENGESQLSLYMQIKEIGDMRLFKDGKKLFFFTYDIHTKEELSAYESKLSGVSNVTIINMMTYCNYKHKNITSIGLKKIGKRKEKEEVECFASK